MKFRNQSRFKGHTITNVVDKPVLHKKSKQWLVVSAFTLALLGGTSIAQANASQVQSRPVTSNNTVNVQAQAGQVHKQLMTNSAQNESTDKDTTNKPGIKLNLQSAPNQGKNIDNPAHQAASTNGQGGFIDPTDRDWDAKNNPDAHYNFSSSDEMYDTHANDYLNNVNHLAHDQEGYAIRPQMEVTYAWDGHEQDHNISTPRINPSIIQELNDRQIGVLPLYNPGVSMRGNGEFPNDNELMQLQNYTYPQASLGYQPEKVVPYRLVGYLFTAPRNTQFTDLFKKYFYPQTDNGYALDTSDNGSYFSYSVNHTTFTGAHSLPADLHFSWENSTNPNFSEHDGTYINLEYAPQTNKITFVDKKTNQPVSQWVSPSTGSGNAFNYALYDFYVNISSPKTYSKSGIDIPKGYILENNDMIKFHNTIYPPSGGYGSNFNYGHDYVIPLSKPDDDTITYTYQGRPVGEWKSTKSGTPDTENPELLNIYNTITAFDAPNMPKGYWIPSGPKLHDSSLSHNNYPFEQFLNALYSSSGGTKGMNYGNHYTVPVSLINPPKESNVTIHYIDADTHMPIADNKTVPSKQAQGASAPINIQGFKYVATQHTGKDITLTYDFNDYQHPNDAKGDIDVFYYHNNKLMLYRDFGSYPAGRKFNVNAFKANGYQVVRGNNVTQFNDGLQTVVLVAHDNSAKTPQDNELVKPDSTITVDFIDNTTGDFITKAGSDTEEATTPFNYNKYLNKMPRGYQYAGVKNNIDSFDDNDHTVDVLLNKTAPVKPKPSSANRPTSQSSAQPSKASPSSTMPSNQANSASSATAQSSMNVPVHKGSSAVRPQSSSLSHKATSKTNHGPHQSKSQGTNMAKPASASQKAVKGHRSHVLRHTKRINKFTTNHEHQTNENKAYRPKNWANFISGVNYARKGEPMHIRDVDYQYGYYGFKHADRAQHKHGRLPQTNEANYHMSLLAAVMLVLSFSFTLADVTKHKFD